MKIMDIIIEELNANIPAGEPQWERLHSDQYGIITTDHGKFRQYVKPDGRRKVSDCHLNPLYECEYDNCKGCPYWWCDEDFE